MDMIFLYLKHFFQNSPEIESFIGSRFYLSPPDAAEIQNNPFFLFDTVQFDEITEGAGACSVTVRIARLRPFTITNIVTALCDRIRFEATAQNRHSPNSDISFFFTDRLSIEHSVKNDYLVTAVTFTLHLCAKQA